MESSEEERLGLDEDVEIRDMLYVAKLDCIIMICRAGILFIWIWLIMKRKYGQENTSWILRVRMGDIA